MAYPPSPTRQAEAYELSSYPPALAGPSTPTSRPRRLSGPGHSRPSGSSHRPRSVRTLTLQNTDASANVLFSAPHSSGLAGTTPTSKRPAGGRRRTISLQGSPGSPHRGAWANFLNEDTVPRDTVGYEDGGGGGTPGRTEEVHVPDFGHMLGFNPEEEDHYTVARGIKAEWRKRLYLLMEEPRSGREAFFVHIFVTGAILFSVVLTTLSTLPTFHLHPTSIQTLFGLDTTLVVLFTIEYLARCLAHADSARSFWAWFTSFFPLLDLLAILPYYIEVAREEDTSILFRFTILRTFRLLRVFRAFKYQNQMLLTIEVMYVAVQRSKDALGAISFFILLVLVLFSTLIYFAERGTWDANVGAFLDADGDPSLFDSIPQTAWFALVTMSTVGYGDVVPRSFLGKLLTMPLLLFGLLLIALPSFVLGRNFAIVFDAMTAQTAQRQASPEQRRSFETPPSPTPPLPASLGTTVPSAHPHVGMQEIDLDNDTDDRPLLPSHSNETLSVLPPYSHNATAGPSRTGRSAPISGAASSVGSVSSRMPSAAQGATGLGLRMGDGVGVGDMGFGGASLGVEGQRGSERDRERSEGRDLTNIKLAKNQLVLLEEIGSLRRVIDRQGEVLARLIALAEGREGDAGGSSARGKETGESTVQLDRHASPLPIPVPSHSVSAGDGQFSIGSEDEKSGIS